MKTQYENLYKFLKETGELKQVFRAATGDWDKDKDKFIKIQKNNEQYLNK